MSDRCSWLSDEQFSKLQSLLLADTRGEARVDDRRVIGRVIHVLKSGGRLIYRPEVYNQKNLYKRFVSESKTGGIIDMLSQTNGLVLEMMIASR